MRLAVAGLEPTSSAAALGRLGAGALRLGRRKHRSSRAGSAVRRRCLHAMNRLLLPDWMRSDSIGRAAGISKVSWRTAADTAIS